MSSQKTAIVPKIRNTTSDYNNIFYTLFRQIPVDLNAKTHKICRLSHFQDDCSLPKSLKSDKKHIKISQDYMVKVQAACVFPRIKHMTRLPTNVKID
ncbi:hypothetical protein HMPREF9098_2371 [Kingella denitrificans ATCC 33394]|uniref:Uncharacterized protein n=1 Tax=Kingella denitrificans ATCC 33394 TaxID=888741 RepID=F0F2M5_9NEIS|nr:hypothetical protein HMPREF9098_2371 [Kingella denitrificans ATCC 33394]